MLARWYPNREDPQLGVFIRKHAEAIATGHDIGVLYVHSQEDMHEPYEIVESVSNGVREIVVYYKKDRSILAKPVNFFRWRRASKLGIDVLKKHFTPDVLHAYILGRSAWMTKRLSKRLRIPYVYSEQWSGFMTHAFDRWPAWKKMLAHGIVKDAATMSVVSSVLARSMKSTGMLKDNFVVIPNAIESYPVNNAKKNDGPIAVLIVADLVDEIKNISGVLNMLPEMRGEKKFVIHIVGGGKDEMKLKSLAIERGLMNDIVFFEGRKKNEEVYEALRRCDFLLVNSRHETFSLICAEALSCGKPVLATRCGGPEEFITEDNGILIRPDSEEELKEGFRWMLAHFKDFDSNKISSYAEERFSKERIGQAFRQLYESVKN